MVFMGDTSYPSALFAEKASCIEYVIQVMLFCLQRQSYLVTLIYDDIAQYHFS